MAKVSATLNSGWMTDAEYDPETKTLQVSTVSGQTYTFEGVPPDVFSDLCDARSAGDFFHKKLKGRY